MHDKAGPKTVADDPALLAAWSPKNGDLRPDEVTVRARRLVWWRCGAGQDHEWRAAPVSVKGCPLCGRTKSEHESVSSGVSPGAPSVRSGLSTPPSPSVAPPAAPIPASIERRRPRDDVSAPAAPPALRAVSIDLEGLEEAFSEGALCFFNPETGDIFLPRRWRDDVPGHVRVPQLDRRGWVPTFIAGYVRDPARQALLRDATTNQEFQQLLNEREEVQWSAYSAARSGMDLRAWLAGLGIRPIPRSARRVR
jgi:hypothetical protein